ncbi:FAD-binding oxidoreductase [Tanticharoenia sakaeratensis]|uniref:FAD linked oxidase domain protein n=1 Tax=Tanticharoenia sakaeratensis NBRC 103193 TaxID=1231623 RepID=A0A0D6MK84_9PROT|nr:FAD-binding oxidoreductase [Tanticharoenia sakaeratensis]GAN53688.1 FAD linked oxidase domain protein [Tanticharoenia sakaeratensis NBRC 103193]GBQ17181.1 oxidoreductase [Tanticharoenia sakaeratensis NBRC 103193]
MPASISLLEDLAANLSPGGLLTEAGDVAPYCTDWRGLFHGEACAVMRPADTAELARAVTICAAHGARIVPQGGNTGLCGGATPPDHGLNVVLVLSRLNRIVSIDPVGQTMVVEAGVTLAAAQNAARDAGLMLPLSIAAEGTAQIGGLIATNAGGTRTVRYGNMRELTLGLEAVTADGDVLDLMRPLRKDNTGYALKHLLIGSEGTLGIVTRAIIQLQPKLAHTEVALCAVPDAGAALDLFAALRARDPMAVEAFEFMSGAGMALTCEMIPEVGWPLSETPGTSDYVLIELGTRDPSRDLRTLMEAVLEDTLDRGVVIDAVLAESETQSQGLWRLREEHTEAQKRAGASIKNDVSVPVPAIPELIARATAACEALCPGIRCVPFGHMGDGNIHFNLVQPADAAGADFLALSPSLMAAVNDVVRALNGSFSAEHGVGQLKTKMMPDWRGGTELALMRAIRTAFDPASRLNPGKVLPADPASSPKAG